MKFFQRFVLCLFTVTITIYSYERFRQNNDTDSTATEQEVPPGASAQTSPSLQSLKRYNETIHVLNVKPIKFDPDYRNPCWKEDGTLHCLPYFFLAGVGKCGTTGMWFYLRSHPQIAVPNYKEPFWWHFQTTKKWANSTLLQYSNIFSRAAVEIEQNRKSQYVLDVGNNKGAYGNINKHKHLNYNKTKTGYIQVLESNRKSRHLLQILNSKHPIISKNAFFEVQDSSKPKQPRHPHHPHPNHQLVTFDASAGTFHRAKSNWKATEGVITKDSPSIVNPDEIHHVLPNARFIVLLRDPVERAYSEYRMRKHVSPEHFHNIVVLNLNTHRKCLVKYSQRTCAYMYIIGLAYIEPGIYHVFVKDWFRKFPRTQIKFIASADFKRNSKKTVNEVLKFLGLDPVDANYYTAVEEQYRKHMDYETTYNIGPMWNKTKKLLQEFYGPHNEKLYNMLKDESFAFRYG